MFPSRAVPAVVAAAVTVAALSGCSPTVTMSAAEFANDPGCAAVIVRLPGSAETLGDYELRRTTAQGTAAWGDPTVALLTCGVDVPTVSELPCIEVSGTQWLREELTPSGEGTGPRADFAFTTYGTDPAIRVVLDSSELSPGIALGDLSTAVGALPRTDRVCTSLDDTVTGR